MACSRSSQRRLLPLITIVLGTSGSLACSSDETGSGDEVAPDEGASSGGNGSTGGGSQGDGPASGGQNPSGGQTGHGAESSGGQASGGGLGTGGNDGSGGEAAFRPDFCEGLRTSPGADDFQVARVVYAAGRLTYPADADMNRIVDFSHAGYHSGEAPLPHLEEKIRVDPGDGDDSSRIQAAIDTVSALPLNADGHRGAVVLSPGVYQLNTTIRINADGVVLRGSGQSSSPENSSILQILGTEQRTAILLGSGDGNPWVTAGSVNVTNNFVQVGSREIDVEDATGLDVGDEVRIVHPSTAAWINAVDGGGAASDPDWNPGEFDLNWVRRIEHIDNKSLRLDAPIFNQIDGSLTTATVAKITQKNLRTEMGVENLRIDIQTQGGEDEAHAWDGVGFRGAENSWATDVTVLHFGHAGIYTSGSIHVTVSDCTALEPVGIRTGGRFYNFDAESHSQLILFENSEAHDGRHNMIVNGSSTASGIVFHRIHSQGASSQSEGHRQWSHGMLFDSITGVGDVQLISRGDYGTAHGWSSAHSVIWQNEGVSRVQKPPTAQNYAFSSVGSLSTSYPFSGAPGEGDVRKSGNLFPPSLYEAQLCERLGDK